MAASAPFTDKNTRNAPKNLRRTSDGRKAAAAPAAAENIRAGIATTGKPSVRSNPCFACTESEKAAIGRKATRLAACAACCSTPSSIVSAGISTVPPPIPIPPKSPDTAPTRR